MPSGFKLWWISTYECRNQCFFLMISKRKVFRISSLKCGLIIMFNETWGRNLCRNLETMLMQSNFHPYLFREGFTIFVITYSDLNSHCFTWHPYVKLWLFKTELVIALYSWTLEQFSSLVFVVYIVSRFLSTG